MYLLYPMNIREVTNVEITLIQVFKLGFLQGLYCEESDFAGRTEPIFSVRGPYFCIQQTKSFLFGDICSS